MEQQILSQGALVGERFEVIELAGEGDLGRVYKARDTKVDKPVALRILSPQLVPKEADVERLRDGVREASTLTHKNIRTTFGLGIGDDDGIYIASEWIDGQNLRALLTKRTEAGKRFSFKGAYNIIGHVCNALTYAHKKTVHRALCPRAIMVSNAGRVKVSDWGLSLIRTGLETYGDREKLEATFWAPEVLRTGDTANTRADVYSLGALFYELITGVLPERPLKAPSALGFSKEVDAVIARCMASEPTQRYATPGEVKAAIAEVVKTQMAHSTQADTDDDLGIDVEFDLTADSLDSEPGLQDASADETAGKSGSMLDAPGLPKPKGAASQETEGSADNRASTIDMGSVIRGLGTSEAARWMVQKDKFDHGPFTDRELVQMMLIGQVIGKHQLLNMETGVRKKVRAWGHFDDYLERYRHKKRQEEEALAKKRTESAEKRSSAFKIIVALGILGFIGLVVGGYFLSRTLRKEKTYTPDEMVAAFDSGEIKLRTGGNLIDKKSRRGRGGRRRSGGGGSGRKSGGEFVPGMSYEDAMNMAIDLGGVHNTGGQKQLSPADITRIMDRNVRRFLPCMAGQSVKRVDMDIAIAGDGRVMGVSIKQGDGRLKKCVTSKARSIKFPTSPAPRTAASWYFEIY
ncbi:MAG: protein kinase [Myxococcota bacterium]|nr:protein kinase [Myxococcota bacterium]